MDGAMTLTEMLTFALVQGAVMGGILAIVLFLMNWIFAERRKEAGYEEEEYEQPVRQPARRQRPQGRARRQEYPPDARYQDIRGAVEEYPFDNDGREEYDPEPLRPRRAAPLREQQPVRRQREGRELEL